jgi:hypothetical protein
LYHLYQLRHPRRLTDTTVTFGEIRVTKTTLIHVPPVQMLRLQIRGAAQSGPAFQSPDPKAKTLVTTEMMGGVRPKANG